MATNVANVVSHFPDAEDGFSTTLASTISSGATTVPLNSVAGYTNGEPAVFVVDPSDASKKQTFTGIIDTAGVQVTNVVWTRGTNQSHTAGATVVDYATATHIAMISKGIKVQHKQDGTHANTITTNVINENTAAAGVTVDGVLLKDNTIQTAGAISPVYTSNPYKFHVTQTSAQGAFSAATKITFTNEVFDTGSNFASSTFTAPITGFYYIYSFVRTAPTGGDTSAFTWVYKNGSQFQITAFAGGTNLDRGLSGSLLMSLAANDTVDIYAQSTGGNITTVASGNTVSYFGGFLMSAT